MATSKWRSSLADIESRVRRSLGIAGPIDLAMEDPPKLTPVMIADDATRPGAASSYRGRRWMATVGISVAAGNRGSAWLFVDAPPGAGGSNDPYKGGAIVDRLTIAVSAGGALRWVMNTFPTDLVIGPPGIPIAVTPDNARYVDPTKSTVEVAPIALYGSAVVPPEAGGGGPQIARWRTPATAVNFQQDLDIFLNWNSALVIGIDPTTVPAATADADFTFYGRIF